MPRKCVVPGCNSGYASCANDKLSVFKCPRDKLAEWASRIPRKNMPASCVWYVCELHFEERFVERTYKTVINGNTEVMERGRPQLANGAVPTIFPRHPAAKKSKHFREEIVLIVEDEEEGVPELYSSPHCEPGRKYKRSLASSKSDQTEKLPSVIETTSS